MANERKVFPKQQLEIVQVHEEKGYGTAGKTLLPVNAKNLSLPEGDPLIGKPLKFTVFNSDLIAHIKGLAVSARFSCDIEEHDRPDSQYGPDRNIVQIYVQGEPVSKKEKGQRFFGKSPEVIQMELDAQFRIIALTQAIETLKVIPGTKAEDTLVLADRYYSWLTKRPAPETDTSKEAKKPAEPITRLAGESTSGSQDDLTLLTFANKGAFYTACLKHFKFDKTKTNTEIVGFDLDKPEQRQKAWLGIVATHGNKSL